MVMQAEEHRRGEQQPPTAGAVLRQMTANMRTNPSPAVVEARAKLLRAAQVLDSTSEPTDASVAVEVD